MQDRYFITSQISNQAYFVRRNNKYEQLPEVLEAFNMAPGKRDLLSRCVKCNGRFKSQCVQLLQDHSVQ